MKKYEKGLQKAHPFDIIKLSKNYKKGVCYIVLQYSTKKK